MSIIQSISPLVIKDFEKSALIILGKAEVDKDGLGNFVELEEVTDFSIQSNITNIFQNTCALSFSINLLNTKDKYSLFDKGASHYGYIKEGRKIRLYLGLTAIAQEDTEEIIEGEIDTQISDGNDDIAIDYCLDGPYFNDEEVSVYVGRCCENTEAYGAFRFPNITIPEGATIKSAKLTFYGRLMICDEEGDATLNISAEAVDNPERIASIEDYESRIETTEKVVIDASIALTEEYGWGDSPDISTVIQAIVDREGWESGNALQFFIKPHDDMGLGMAFTARTADFSEGEYAPKLFIEYEYTETTTTETEGDYIWSWIYGIIDKPSMSYSETSEMCSITGRDYIAYLSETYLKKLWWGTNLKFNVVADQAKYAMPSNCTGIYRVFMDKTGTRTAFKEITLNSEYTYDWQTNELVFLIPSVPTENATGCLWIYYHTAINVATLVADLLTEAGIMNASERYLWLSNTDICTPTAKTIQRAWFESGTSYITAINMLTEVATIYRFYINGAGQPCFKQIPLLSTTIKRIDDEEYLIRNTEERLDELYNHFIIIGEYREMKKINLAVIAYTTLYDMDTESGEVRGAILDNGGFTLTSRGFKLEGGSGEGTWSESTSAIGYYTHIFTGLDPDTEYKFCAYGTNAGGDKKQSPWVYFKTLPEEE